MRKRWRWLLALAGLVVLVAGASVLWPRADRITQENFDRINDGMSQAEVEAILGPPGDFRTLPPAPVDATHQLPIDTTDPTDESIHEVRWFGDKGWIVVGFTNNDQVTSVASFDAASEIPNGHLDNLLWQAKRQWRRWFPLPSPCEY